MLRVLLLIEDYGESVFLQILLSKLGFDVETLKNPKALNDSLLRIHPDILIVTGRGRRFNGFEIATRTKKSNGKPKFIMLVPANAKSMIGPGEAELADCILDTPVSPSEMIEGISRITHLDSAALLDKYKKMKSQLQEESDKAFSQASAPSDEEVLEVRSERAERNKKFLKLDEPPKQKNFAKTKIVNMVKTIRAEGSDPQIDKERQAFVRELFKKKSIKTG